MKVVKGLKSPREHGYEFSPAATFPGRMRATLSGHPLLPPDMCRAVTAGAVTPPCSLSLPLRPSRLAAQQSARWEQPAGLAAPQLVQTCVFLQALGLRLLPGRSEIWLQRRKWGYFLGNGKLSRWKT